MPKVNKTKYAILGILNNRPSSGYDIKKFCDESLSYFWNENYGHIYPVLKKMEQEKLIVKQIVNDEGKISKNVYTVTETGKKILNEWLALPAEYQPVRNEFLLKLVFSKDVPRKEIIGKIVSEKTKALKILDELKVIEKKLESDPGLKKSRTMQAWFMSARYYIMQISTSIKWCDESIKRLTGNE